MANLLSRADKEIAKLYERHKETVFRVCFAYMKNVADTEDVMQDAFYKLIKSNAVFESVEHEKAWLIRTATNLCKNALRYWWRKRENLEDYKNLQSNNSFEIDDVFSVVMTLPDKYKTVIYLYYHEGYNSVEIAEILQKPQPTIRYYLSEARKILRKKLGGDFLEEQ